MYFCEGNDRVDNVEEMLGEAGFSWRTGALR